MMEMKDVNIKKIKFSRQSQKIIINFERVINGNVEEFHATYSELARPEFYNAFESLAKDVLDILEIPISIKNRVHPYGINLKYLTDGYLQAIISSHIDMYKRGEQFSVDTPVMKERVAGAVPNLIYFTDDCMDKIRAIITETLNYMNGKRAQMELFDDSDNVQEESAAPIHEEDKEQDTVKISAAAPSDGKISFN